MSITEDLDEGEDLSHHAGKKEKKKLNEKAQRTLKRAINSLRNAIVLQVFLFRTDHQVTTAFTLWQENQANVAPEGVDDQVTIYR